VHEHTQPNAAFILNRLTLCHTLEKIMKKLVLAATVSLAATSAFAGGMAEPVMEPAVVEAQTSSSSGGIVVALLLLLVIAAAASN
jgi:hypothetical protein